MANPSPKRRKLDHGLSSDEDENASFDSFEDDTDAQGGGEDLDIQEEDVDEQDANDDKGEEDDSWHDAAENQEGGGGRTKTTATTAKSPQISAIERSKESGRSQKPTNGVHLPGAVKSNAFQIQIDDLLDRIRPRHGKREQAAENALHKLKNTIERIPNRDSLSVEEAERQLLMSSKVVIPFPAVRPPKDAKYRLEYKKPANINVVGSYALKTRPRSKEAVQIDMTVTMPSSLFQEKDFLNYRYFYKRAYFIACIAAGLQEHHRHDFQIHFQNLHDNHLQPALVITPRQGNSKDDGKSYQPEWIITIMPCVGSEVFSLDKLRPDRNCVRAKAPADENDGAATNNATPFYNSSIRADMVSNTFLKLMSSASKRCTAFQDACLLGNTWLRQRGLGSQLHSGGFGRFELNALMAVLLESGVSDGRPILSEGYSSYQLWKATLQLIAMKDFSKDPCVLGQLENGFKPSANALAIVWDATRAHNLLFKMTPWSYKWLKQEARLTLSMLNDQSLDLFAAAFAQRSFSPCLRYDYTLQLQASLMDREKSHVGSSALPDHLRLYNFLMRGLGERVKYINIIPPGSEEWEIGFKQACQPSGRRSLIGILVNPETVERTVDHGPSAEKKDEAASFRDFWGEKAELRRFKDGNIHESVVWSDAKSGQSIAEQVVRYVIAKHVSSDVQQSIEWTGDGFRRLLPRAALGHSSADLLEAFKRLEHHIRSLSELPLSVRQIAPADAQLRHASFAGAFATPADVVIQFEGSVRWPDDLVAIQRTKMAFLLNVSRLLQESVNEITSRVGLENSEHDVLNQAFLDIVYDSGAAFRLRIHHDREQALLERKLKDKTLDPRSKELAALGLTKYKRDYVKAPAFTQSISRLCGKHPAMSGTIRLLKKWFSCHLLANQIAEEIIELFVARTFTQPWPWQTPSSVQIGFLRTLEWLSRWDWRNELLIVDLSGSGDLKQADFQSITTRLEAWRKLDPLLNRLVLFCASNVDPEGTAWTEGRPMKVIAARMTALAKSACAEVEEKQLQLDPLSLFSSSLSDFDFVVHLQPDLLRGRRKQAGTIGTAFKNLELQANFDPSLCGYEPVQEFLRELEHLFGGAVVFFSGGLERPVIAGLWDPSTAERAWKLNLGCSIVPIWQTGKEEVLAEINKTAVLAEIAKLGGDLVERIEMHR